MTVTEKQAWLWRYQRSRPRMDLIRGSLARKGDLVRELATLEAQPCHPARRRTLAAERQRLTQEMEGLNRELAELEEDRMEIARAIEGLEEERYRRLLAYHYLEGWPWQQVACRLEYSLRYIYKLHKLALEAIECRGRKRQYHLRATGCRIHCFPRKGAAI